MTISSPTLHASNASSTDGLMLTDFTPGSSDLGWHVVNDTVMGGRSEGDFKQDNGELNFTGRTNTKGGGFSSIRTKPLQLDLSNYAGVQLYLKGDGRRYTWRLTTNARWRGKQVSYWADFGTKSGLWRTVNIPFSRFIPKYRGDLLDGPALETSQITGMGLMIYDKQDGPFKLRLSSIHTYSLSTPFTLSQFQWRHRVLVLSARTGDDETLNAQQNAVVISAVKFAERDMLLVNLLNNGVSTAGDRTLTTAEVDAARAELDIRPGSFALRLIGKDGTVKLAENTAVAMDEIYALIDGMPMRRRETTDRQ